MAVAARLASEGMVGASLADGYTCPMDLSTARRLSALTTDFYQRVAASFSATRQSAWPGWERVLAEAALPQGEAAHVLDLGCGNQRFARYLAGQGVPALVWGVDSCDVLAGECSLGTAHFRHLDITGTLYDGGDLQAALRAPVCDLAVSFGFLHHVPLQSHRIQIVRALVGQVRPGGLVAVSLWQFARDERIMARARPADGAGEGDYLLGWQGNASPARYCHSFAEHEVDELAVCAGDAREVARFSADGRSGSLNRYLLLRRAGR